MKENYTDITVILDRSGSMGCIRQDTIGGFNTFLADQQRVPGECTFSLIQFDNEYEENYIGRDIQEVAPLNENTFRPRGSTALLDAMGKTIGAIGARIWKMTDENKPSKVIVVIITDGHENASIEYQKEQINSMIRFREDEEKWEFVFLGANMDAVSAGTSYGVKAGSSMTWESSSKGVINTFQTMSAKMSSYRVGAFDPNTTDYFDANDRASAVSK